MAYLNGRKIAFAPKINIDGYDNGFADGKQAEYDAFWDAYQENGNRVQYIYGFSGRGWTNANFNPKYTMKCSTGAFMFSGTGIERVYTDKLDMSTTQDFGNMFYGGMSTNYAKYVGALDMSNAKVCTSMFSNCTNLEEIERLTFPSDPTIPTSVNNMFTNCKNLKEIRFAGVIPLSISFAQSSKLSRASIESIIAALSPTTTGEITFSQTAVDKEFETSEGANDGSTSDDWLDFAVNTPWGVLLA